MPLVIASLFLSLALVVPAAAQSPAVTTSARAGGLEIGVAVGAINLNAIVGEKPLATSWRVGYRFARAIGVEGEVTICHADNSGNYGETLWLGGPKAGIQRGPVTVMGKLRAGAIRFAGRAFRAHNGGPRTAAAVDVGAIVELAFTPRVALRIDGGRTIVPFGRTSLYRPLPPYTFSPGTTFNGQGTVGLQVRF